MISDARKFQDGFRGRFGGFHGDTVVIIREMDVPYAGNEIKADGRHFSVDGHRCASGGYDRWSTDF